jgi:very-short-patch-repair endonuclease
VSHQSAAALWRIETLASGADARLEFIDPVRSARPEGKGVHAHRIALATDDVVDVQGLRVTGPVRTVADLLRAGPRDNALVALESALSYRRVGQVRRAPLTRLDAITAALDPSLRGSAGAHRLLQLCDPQAGSPAETIARLRMHDAGLRPESQIELITPAGRQLFLDFLFRREGLGVEIEGYAYHGTREAHRRDIARFNEVLQCPEVRGGLLRYTATDVFQRPGQMIEGIRTALRTSVGRTSSAGLARQP